MPSNSPPASTQSAILENLQRLIDVVAQLRSPDGGCPWDLAQTPQTLIPYVIEEAYETADALRHGDEEAIADELGDLLLQVVLQAQIASEAGQFDLATVADRIATKLVRRHPHVFGDVSVADTEEVRQNWEQIKLEETRSRGEDPRLSAKLKHYTRSLPPLMAAMKISKKAARAGFEWDSIEGVWGKFEEELAEFQHALAHEEQAEQQAELGDLFFTLIQIARWAGLNPSEALQGTNDRFIQRLEQMEAIADRPLTDYSIAELEAFWQQAKATLKQNSSC
jgi:XTP/dITP diphosphohydrolase